MKELCELNESMMEPQEEHGWWKNFITWLKGVWNDIRRKVKKI